MRAGKVVGVGPCAQNLDELRAILSVEPLVLTQEVQLGVADGLVMHGGLGDLHKVQLENAVLGQRQGSVVFKRLSIQKGVAPDAVKLLPPPRCPTPRGSKSVDV